MYEPGRQAANEALKRRIIREIKWLLGNTGRLNHDQWGRLIMLSDAKKTVEEIEKGALE